MDVYINMHEITWLWGDRDWDFKVSRKVQYALRVSRKLWESVEKPIRKLLARYACDMPEIYLKLFLIYVWDIPKICLRYASDKPEICLRYAWDMSEICLRYARDISEICLRHVHNMHETFLRDAWDMTRSAWVLLEICLRYAEDMLEVSLRSTLYMLEIL